MRFRLLSYFLLLSFVVQAQKKFAGRVMSQDSSTPVTSANIYLSNTSIGTVTDEKGNFTFKNFPEGRYELIVSCVGYETYRSFIRSDQLTGNFMVYMQPKIAELEAVVITNDPYDKFGWSRYGHFFMDNFMGTGSFAEECKLMNPEVLRFRVSKTNVVKITAGEDLLIENNALGYILKYSLTNFVYSLVTKDFVYQGFPFFTEMQTTNKRLQKKWLENRESVYRGSLLHFMRSVHQDKIKEEKFEVREWVKVTDAEKKRVREMFDRQNGKFAAKTTSVSSSTGKSLYLDEKDTATIINKDTLSYFRSVMKQIRQEDVLIDILLSAEHISSTLDSTSKELTFGNKIEVVYLPKSKHYEYQRSLPPDQKYQLVVSDLYNAPGHLVFSPNGSFSGGDLVRVAGYWSWEERMCHKVPYDYAPVIKDIKKEETNSKSPVKRQSL
jgi:hypothetical protein